jgi:serine/threonine protein kinase
MILLKPSTVVANFRIVQLLGQGGTSAVYEAVAVRTTASSTITTGQHIALKEIFDARIHKQLQREFAILHRVEHDHLPRYYEVFEHQGRAYLVMELVSGQSLEDVLSRKPQGLAVAQVLGYALQLCDVLNYLHSQPIPIYHRDLKPANVRLTPDGLIKLVDFGLMKEGTAQTQHSIRGYGTEAYAPIEQYGNNGTDQRTDLYSLGATIYHLLTGQIPPSAIARATQTPDPLLPLEHYNPSISPSVSAAITQALAVQPGSRFSSIAEFRHALMGYTSKSSVSELKESEMTGIPTTRLGLRAAMQNADEKATQSLGSLEVVSVPETPIIVDQTGRGHFQSISEALRRAVPGSVIAIRPGLYRENLVLDKDVELSGLGPRSEIIVECTEPNGLMLDTKHAALHSLTVRHRPPRGKQQGQAIQIRNGQSLIADCEISTTAAHCVVISSEAADPSIHGCVIHGAAETGVIVATDAKSTIVDCDIFGNAVAQVALQTGADATIQRCRFHDGYGVGVNVTDRARGIVEDCQIYNHNLVGILIAANGDATIRNCTIKGAKQWGIRCNVRGIGTVEGCDISDTMVGIGVSDSMLTIRKCKIHNNSVAVDFEKVSQGSIEDCNFWDQQAGHVVIRQDSKASVLKCEINDSQGTGITLTDRSQGSVENCTIRRNTNMGITLAEFSSSTITQCEINHNQIGITVMSSSSARVEQSDLTANWQGAWKIAAGCRVQRKGNKE